MILRQRRPLPTKISAICIALFVLFQPLAASAQALIRDAEVEHILREYADPIFTSAGLSPSAIKIFIIQDKSLNAYVMGGSNLFLHTGIILAAEDPMMLIGVLAHETGHIAGGHLAQGAEKLKNAELGVVLTYILGAAAAAGGSSELGAAVMSAGQQAATRNILAYSRANEQSADQAALTYLDSLKYPSSGLLHMFERLRQGETRRFGEADSYTLTHPLTRERIMHIRGHVMQSKLTEKDAPKKFVPLHARMLAKLQGFLDPPLSTLAKYPKSDTSLPARYARTIAYFRMPDLPKALNEIDSLLAEHPNDPFFNELKGQMLFENGKLKEALVSYREASRLLPDSALILTDLAKTELATEDNSLLPDAIRHLEKSSLLDNANSQTWRLLATAYGKQGEEGRAQLSLAEEAILRNKPEEALSHLDLAAAKLPAATPAHLRTEDLRALARKMKEDNS